MASGAPENKFVSEETKHAVLTLWAKELKTSKTSNMREVRLLAMRFSRKLAEELIAGWPTPFDADQLTNRIYNVISDHIGVIEKQAGYNTFKQGRF